MRWDEGSWATISADEVSEVEALKLPKCEIPKVFWAVGAPFSFSLIYIVVLTFVPKVAFIGFDNYSINNLIGLKIELSIIGILIVWVVEFGAKVSNWFVNV